MDWHHVGGAQQRWKCRIQGWDQSEQQRTSTLKQKKSSDNQCIPKGSPHADGTCLHEVLGISISRLAARGVTAPSAILVNAIHDKNASMPVVTLSQANQTTI